EAKLEPAVEHAVVAPRQQPQPVVVRRRAPELEPGAAEEGAAAVPTQLCQQAGPAPDPGPHAVRLEDDRAGILARAASAPVPGGTTREGERDLMPRDLMRGRRPGGLGAAYEAEGDEALAARAALDVERDVHSLTRSGTQPRQRAPAYDRAILAQLPG